MIVEFRSEGGSSDLFYQHASVSILSKLSHQKCGEARRLAVKWHYDILAGALCFQNDILSLVSSFWPGSLTTTEVMFCSRF